MDLAQAAAEPLVETNDEIVYRSGNGELLGPDDVPDWLEEVIFIQHNAGAGRADINLSAFRSPTDYGGPEAVLPGGYDRLLPELAGDYEVGCGKKYGVYRGVKIKPAIPIAGTAGVVAEDQEESFARAFSRYSSILATPPRSD